MLLPSTPWLNVKAQKQLLLLLLSLLLGLAFIDRVAIAQPGLDPSWSIALTRAHAEGLTWGKEIIFTYGSLGYLFFGRFLKDGFFEMQFARYLVAIAWVFLSLRFVINRQVTVLKILGLIAFIGVPILGNTLEFDAILLENKFILIIQLLILEAATPKTQVEQAKFATLKPYSYGVLSIFFLLIKFNFGLLSVLCFSTIALSNRLINRLQRSSQPPSFSLNGLLFGYLIGLLIFLSPLARSPFFALALAYGIGAVATLLCTHPQTRSFPPVVQKLIPIALLLTTLIFVFCHPSLLDFIHSSLELTKGYSQSMGIIGDRGELKMGILLLFGIVILGGITVLIDWRNLGGVIALLLLSLMSFKHGFVRHDAHVVLFAFMAPAYLVSLGSLAFDRSSNPLGQRVRFLCIIFVTIATTFALGLGTSTATFTQHYELTPLQTFSALNPVSLTQKIALLIHPQATAQKLLSQKDSSLADSKISETVALDALQNQTVDVQPWEVSLVEANPLQWHPTPIFQAYSAYTHWLDEKNLNAYQTDPPDKILYSFISIDNRHPYFDQPQTNLWIQCHYQPQKNIPILTPATVGKTIILEKRATPLCQPNRATPIGSAQSVPWDKALSIESIRQRLPGIGHSLLLRLEIQYSLLGKLYNTIYRTPQIVMEVQYQSGQQVDYRIVPDTAKGGFLIDLPRTFQEVLQDFAGVGQSDPVRAIALTTDNPTVFAPTVNISFWDLKKQAQLPPDFNPVRYLELNPDVKAAGAKPRQHYLEFGFFEGRRYN
jgi:hypothetical protein